jgi:hypothetical protein
MGRKMVKIKCIFLPFMLLFLGCSLVKMKEWGMMGGNDYVPHQQENLAVFIRFWRSAGEHKYGITGYLRLDKPYDIFYFHELSFFYRGETIYLIKNLKTKLSVLKEVIPEGKPVFYTPLDGWSPEIRFNHRAIFKDMRVGEKIKLEFTQTYAFDDEPVQTQTFFTTVTCYERDMELPTFMYLP